MVRRGSELYKLTVEKFREPKGFIETAVKISKFAILILKEIANIIAKLQSQCHHRKKPLFELLRHVKFEIYTLHKIRKSK
ncbi:hypothetical protein [uncultured Campylobacter sp.]|uniref:hypothetical protein n=1 Tax=uncultured Campylobacter sp. TaxID=218934 RepID=UPI00260ECA51|nr:hypothetical protein [uncultured Campylobacter sp.]